MQQAKLLLEKLTELISPGENQRHNLTFDPTEKKLQLTLMVGDQHIPFILREGDLSRPTEAIVDVICRLYCSKVTVKASEREAKSGKLISNWTSTRDSLPDRDRLVLAKGGTHEGVALARFDGVKWRVQPFWDVWYETKTGLHEWTNIPLQYKEEDTLQEKKVININFGSDMDLVTLEALLKNIIVETLE